ncbi:hypothetical protein NDU88_000411 [Pleurodeles waltl]|uniref:Uncharacterized protein n=1 Tax=Pleurodeles waltl TaxID=8319 RepID=A0AAV7WII3_PLEWA|nr:hypothetical protein NDU88_000411 [Pleurodeles waltl]
MDYYLAVIAVAHALASRAHMDELGFSAEARAGDAIQQLFLRMRGSQEEGYCEDWRVLPRCYGLKPSLQPAVYAAHCYLLA